MGVFTRLHKVIISNCFPPAPGLIIIGKCIHPCTPLIENGPVLTMTSGNRPFAHKRKYLIETIYVRDVTSGLSQATVLSITVNGEIVAQGV